MDDKINMRLNTKDEKLVLQSALLCKKFNTERETHSAGTSKTYPTAHTIKLAIHRK